jgi:hypothetical protein
MNRQDQAYRRLLPLNRAVPGVPVGPRYSHRRTDRLRNLRAGVTGIGSLMNYHSFFA